MGPSPPSSLCLSSTCTPIALRGRSGGSRRDQTDGDDGLSALSGNDVATVTRAFTSSRGALPALPPELWARVLSHVASGGNVRDLGVAAHVCRTWCDELQTRRADGLWRAAWDAGSLRPADDVVPQPRSWRACVAASRLLAARSARERLVRLPPRSHLSLSASSARDAVVAVNTPGLGDLQDALGRATAIHAFSAGPVLIGFERGLTLLRSPEAQVLKRAHEAAASDSRESTVHLGNAGAAGQPPDVLDVEQSSLLGGVVLFAKYAGRQSDNAVIAATTTGLVIAIEVDLTVPCLDRARDPAADRPSRAVSAARQRMLRSRRPRVIKWRILDNFEMTQGHLVSLSRSHRDDGRFVLAGFSNGHIRVVDIEAAHLVHVLSMRGSPDLIVACGRWIVASSFFAPISFTCWDMDDGRAVHRFDQTCVGWEEITTMAGVCPTRQGNSFALWDGKGAIRILDVSNGRFSRLVEARGVIDASSTRGLQAESELGAAAAHIGPHKLVLSADGKTCIVAASNRVLIVDIDAKSVCKRVHSMRQFNEARRALLAVSTDNRLLVTAEGDMFGALTPRFASFAGATSVRSPRICVWDIETGDLKREICGVGRISEISVANGTIAVISARRPEPSQGDSAMSRGDALVFRFDSC
jgi:hypothetical protein